MSALDEWDQPTMELWTTRAELARLRELEAAVLEWSALMADWWRAAPTERMWRAMVASGMQVRPNARVPHFACRVARESAAKPECSGPESALCPVHDVLMGPVHVDRERAADPETEKREPGCQCHEEVGDSPCRVHGDTECEDCGASYVGPKGHACTPGAGGRP
jgi:hypothetical protein